MKILKLILVAYWAILVIIAIAPNAVFLNEVITVAKTLIAAINNTGLMLFFNLFYLIKTIKQPLI